MYLKALELRGFKSFPDKTKLDFEKGITAVVGPNGSGKSNISDAVKWVLGEMSPKSLRGQKMEDVIFSGTAKRPQTGFCEVSLFINNSDKELSCDYDEVKITRKYFRTGESEYKINEKTSRLKDIYELFLNTGIGREGYSVIGQGKISEVLSQKSEERRHIFEEAAEISKYRYRKNEAQKKLGETETNLIRVSDIANEIGVRIPTLEKDAENAKKYLVLADRKKELEVAIWLERITKAATESEKLEQKYEQAKSSYTGTEQELETMDVTLEKAFEEKQALAVQNESERDALKIIEEEYSRLLNYRAISENDIAHHEERKNTLLAERKINREVQAPLLQKEYAEGQNECKEKDLLFLQAKEAVALFEQKQNEKQVLLESTLHALEEAKKVHRATQDALTSAKITKAAAENAQKSELERRSFLELEIEKIKTERSETELYLNNAKLRRDAFFEEKKALLCSIEEEKKTLATWNHTLEQLAVVKQDSNAKLSAMIQRRDTLERMDRLLEGYPGSVKAVMNEPSLKGICGPVSRLLSVAGIYVTAIETALGAAVTNIVVENEASAKNAIRFLKDKGAGRATFLPLTSIRGNLIHETGLEKEPGYVGIASMLVAYDDKYKSIAEYLLGRTLVADDIENASVIARKYAYRFRIVTLDGQIINSGGSYTGGSAAARTGVMSRNADIDHLDLEIERIKITLAKNTLSLKEASEEKTNTLQYIESLTNDLSNADSGLYKSEGDINLHTEHIERASLRLDSTEKQLYDVDSGANRERLDTLSAELQSVQFAEVESAKEEARLESETELAQNEREKSRTALSDCRLTYLAAEKDIASSKERLLQIEKRIEENERHFVLLEQEIALIEQKRSEIQTAIEHGSEKQDELEQKIEQKKVQIKEQIKKMTDFEYTITVLRNTQKDKLKDKEVFFREFTKYESQLNQYRNEYDSLTAKLWEEYELSFTDAKGLSLPTPDAASNTELATVKAKIRSLGTVNVNAVEEYNETKDRYDFMTKQIDDLENSKKSLDSVIRNLESEMRIIFAEAIVKINQAFGEVFVELFGGGKAEIIISEPENILESGIEIIVQPPGKLVKNISLLSGGEQAFTAIALYFAILRIHPAPFYIFDEIEAALDDVNVNRFGAYLRKHVKDTQFIVITHRRGTMEAANTLYGVTMLEKGVSNFLKVNIDEVEKKTGLKL